MLIDGHNFKQLTFEIYLIIRMIIYQRFLNKLGITESVFPYFGYKPDGFIKIAICLVIRPRFRSILAIERTRI